MLNGPDLGKALAIAIRRKGVTKTAVAIQFGVKAPSVHGWIRHGRISKEHIDGIVAYFAGVVGPDHWGLPPEWATQYPLPVTAGLSPDEGKLIRLWRELLLDEQRESVLHALEREASLSRKATAEVKRRGLDRPILDGAVALHLPARPAQRDLPAIEPAKKPKPAKKRKSKG